MVSLARSSSFDSSSGGTSAGGGLGGSLKITALIHVPRVIGCVREGVEVIVSTAALVINPPRRGSVIGTRLNNCTCTSRPPRLWPA